MKLWGWALAVSVVLTACAVGAQEADAPPREIASPAWKSQPQPGDFAWAYPPQALKDHIDGQVLLDCEVNAVGRLQGCVSDIEIPEGRGFEAAARNLAGLYTLAPTLEDGSSAAGARVKAPFTFNWQGREASTEVQGGAPVAQAEPEANSPISDRAAFVGGSAFLLTFLICLLIDLRWRDRELGLGGVLGRALGAIPRHWRRAPVPLGITVVLGIMTWPLGDDQNVTSVGKLLVGIASFFMVASALRVSFRDYGRRFEIKSGGLQFGEVEGTVWASRLALAALVFVAGLVVVLLMFLALQAARAVPVIDSFIAPVTGVLTALVTVAACRMSFLTPLSVAAGSVDLRGAWEMGRGRLGAAVVIIVLGLTVTLVTGFVAGAMGVLTSGWFGGLLMGVGYSLYFSFLTTAAAEVVLKVRPPKTPVAAESPLGVVL